MKHGIGSRPRGSLTRPLTKGRSAREEIEMKRLMLALVVVSLVLSAGCKSALTRKDPRKYEGLDRRLDAFTYIEEGKLVAFAVNTQAARYREAEAYIPLAVGIANKGTETIRLDRESFVLQDEAGKQYPMATYSEINEHYQRVQSDNEFTSFYEIWAAKWPLYARSRSAFFPVRSAETVQDFVELPPFFAFADYLYFPKPEGGVVGHRFELHAKAQGLPDPVFVKFIVD